MSTNPLRIGFIGYGEVGRTFAEDLRADGLSVIAFDCKFLHSDDPMAQEMRSHAIDHSVSLVQSDAEVAAAADLIFSAVTASQAETVAQSLSRSIRTETIVVDLNSASPAAKQRSGTYVDGAGGRYVEAAVMTSVPPYRTKVPMLLGGAHANVAHELLTALGFSTTVVADEVGIASATKMARSVMIKGLEAMVIESFTTARHYGVEDALLTSLAETFPGIDWERQGDYFFQRVIQHGRRRAEEVREVARTVKEAGLSPWSAQGTALRQDWVADMVADGQLGDRQEAASAQWRTNADRLLRAQPMSDGWLAPHPSPAKPSFVLPIGAIDAHCHVFGPASEFPYAPERKYTPCDAGKERLFALRDRLGFHANVIVQATCHGTDNRALLDALRNANGRARGVVSLDRSVTDDELRQMHDAGVRGVRFNFVKRLVDFTPREVLQEIASRIAPLGWHVVIYFEAADLHELQPFFASLPTTVVVDHMGRPDVSKPVDGPEFSAFVRFMREHPHVWSKVTCPERLSKHGAPAIDGEPDPYRDVIPFARLIVETFPERVLWGTDWPHPNLTGHMPDDGLLVDFIPRIAPTAALQQKLLVDNPTRLYWAS